MLKKEQSLKKYFDAPAMRQKLNMDA